MDSNQTTQPAPQSNEGVTYMSDLTMAQAMQQLGAFAIEHGLEMTLHPHRRELRGFKSRGYVRLLTKGSLASLVVDLDCGGCELQVAGDASNPEWAEMMLDRLTEEGRSLIPHMSALNRRFAIDVPF